MNIFCMVFKFRVGLKSFFTYLTDVFLCFIGFIMDKFYVVPKFGIQIEGFIANQATQLPQVFMDTLLVMIKVCLSREMDTTFLAVTFNWKLIQAF